MSGNGLPDGSSVISSDYDTKGITSHGLASVAIQVELLVNANAKHQTRCSSRYLISRECLLLDLGFRTASSYRFRGEVPRKNLEPVREETAPIVQMRSLGKFN
jgi:hypothetical protein